ncbi:MAG: energy transducer TonB [Alphaproteobacteria bacterium]|nr:energy transducer TonB [Alphaproteobacteria bacterium]
MLGALPRYIVALPSAVVATVAIFFLMRALVTTKYELPVSKDTVSISVTRQEKKENAIDDDLFAPPSAQDTPPPPPLDLEAAAPSDLSGTPIALPGMEGIKFGQGAVISSNSPTLIYMPQEYPSSYSGRLNYWVRVTVEFDTTVNGTAENIRVIGIDPPNAPDAFKQETIRAFQRAKFKPPLDEKGNPKPTTGNQLTLAFDPKAQ